MTKGFYLMAPIIPWCGPVRVPATLLETLPNGRVLLRDDSMHTVTEFRIETVPACFEPSTEQPS